MKTDQVFKEPMNKSTDFKFDAQVANVFNDMVSRSVPYYLEMQRMMAEIIPDYVLPNSSVYDLGCSTGTTLLSLDELLDQSIRFVGVDSSAEMIKNSNSNFRSSGVTRPYDLITADLYKPVKITDASVVILCLTLQFIRPLYRQKMLESVYQQMNEGACLILIEKILAEDADLNRQFINYYYNLKRRNSYDEMEISQKREALENVLIPYKLSENIAMLEESGFTKTEVFFKWYNFAGIIAIK
ncbi:MAG TPA: carboxy-S-adenosyl-L-methionine synthase CmoA [Prolixibacteraceae bacterium]|nr:MAG: carboxy-S-adenosyl-L-methionine synthase CmoA [Bacteroidetes bacterium GWB2_41_8]HAQ20047.1 carboxy-S-adenosyl-L-methionine synthase CmoA [Prolixibacteraceae bacterium]HBY52675.1 carboxy-S-adenosyl-L-methionine synthase CmoA [Marinilabiliales bacterium]